MKTTKLHRILALALALGMLMTAPASAAGLLGWLFGVIGGLAGLALFVVGLLCAAQLLTTGRASELPFIGFLRLIPLEDDQPER